MPEVILTEEEYYDLFKSLRFALDHVPEALPGRKDLLDRLVLFYKFSPEAECQFVISVREVESEVGNG